MNRHRELVGSDVARVIEACLEVCPGHKSAAGATRAPAVSVLVVKTKAVGRLPDPPVVVRHVRLRQPECPEGIMHGV